LTIFGKTKTINPQILAHIAEYACILPILVFFSFSFNWREKLKWACVLLILVHFTFDLLGNYFSKRPVAEGMVLGSSLQKNRHIAILSVKSGQLHESQLFRAKKFTGIISKLLTKTTKTFQDSVLIEINSDSVTPIANGNFKTYSTLKFANTLLIIDLILIFWIFRMIFRDNRWLQKLTLIAITLSVILWIYRNIFLEQIHQYGGIYNAGTSMLVIFFALIYFYCQLNNPENLFVYASPSFWIVVAILLFKAGTFFLFLYANSLDQHDLANFYVFDSIFYIIQNLLFAIAFLVPEKNRISNTG
jgi:hypothetical protein